MTNGSANVSHLKTEECLDGWTFERSEFLATTVSEVQKPPEQTIGKHHVATALEVTNYFIWYPHKIYGMPLTLKEF